MKNRKIKVSRRHLAKTITWRCVGTLDTILLAYVISGDISSGLQIGLVEIFSKMLLYYFHERVWFNTKAPNNNENENESTENSTFSEKNRQLYFNPNLPPLKFGDRAVDEADLKFRAL